MEFYANCSITQKSLCLLYLTSTRENPVKPTVMFCPCTGENFFRHISDFVYYPCTKDCRVNHSSSGSINLRVGAGKSLARPGRKQATATKLGIYSTYSQRSSIHFLARCSNFCKPLKKKNSDGCPSNQVSAAAMTSVSDEKWRLFNCLFSPGNRCSPMGPGSENKVGGQNTGSPGRPVSFGLQVPGEPGHCRARTRPPLVTFPPSGVFPSKCPSIAPAEMSKTPR